MDFLETFTNQGIKLDLFENSRKVFATAEQCATGLGYKTVRGIYKLVNRNPKLKEKKFSSLVPVKELSNCASTQIGYSQKATMVRIFNRRGMIELARYAKTEQAELFFDKLLDRIETLEKAFRRAELKHQESKPLQSQLHETINKAPFYVKKYGEKVPAYIYMQFNSLLSKLASRNRATKKENLMAFEIEILNNLEMFVCSLLAIGKDYKEISPMVKEYSKNFFDMAEGA